MLVRGAPALKAGALVACLVLVAHFAPAGTTLGQVRAQSSPEAELERARQLDVEAAVRAVYGIHVTQLQASGRSIAVELSDFRIIRSDEYDTVRLRDVLTFLPARRVVIQRHGYSRGDQEVAFSLDAKWESVELSPNDPNRDYNPTLREGLEARSSAYSTPVPPAVASFRARVTLDGSTESYRSMFLIHDYSTVGPITQFTPSDWVFILWPQLVEEKKTAISPEQWQRMSRTGMAVTPQPSPGPRE